MANQTGFKQTKDYSDIVEGADYCPHVTSEDTSKAVGFFYEKDSHGYVGAVVVCEECRVEAQEEVDASPTQCADCGEYKPRKVVRPWLWYDFYAPAGEVPRNVCNTCWELPKHQQRMKDDADARDREFGSEDTYDFSDD